MKKLLIVLVASLALSVPAFADTDPSFASELYYGFSSDTTSRYHLYSDSGVYFYAKLSGATTYIYAISETRGSIYYQSMLNIDTSEFATNTAFGDYFNNLVTYNADIYLGTPLSVFPSDTSDADIQAAFSAFLESNNTPAVISSFNVPCGNVVYFQVTSEQDVTLKSYNQVLSSLLTFSALGPWGDTGQRFGPAANLPSTGTSFPLLSQDPIHWNIDASSVNLLGQSRTAVKTVHCIANQWYAFYNPAYNSNNTDWTVNDITGATVGVFGSFAQVKVYPLEQVVDFSNGSFVGSSNDDYQSYYDGTIGDDGSVTFTDQDGNISTPSAGGQNLLAPNESYQSLIDRVIAILDEIVHELKSLFTFGYEAVQDLVGIMRDFVSVLGGLYTWLPAEVYSALMSAVVVAIVIGVFKVFL